MKDFDKMPLEAFQDECYRLYQLDWMAAHGYSVADLAVSVLAHLDGDGPVDANREADEFASWELDSGFGGELWACREEFLDNEYRDGGYMRRLLHGAALARYEKERR